MLTSELSCRILSEEVKGSLLVTITERDRRKRLQDSMFCDWIEQPLLRNSINTFSVTDLTPPTTWFVYQSQLGYLQTTS